MDPHRSLRDAGEVFSGSDKHQEGVVILKFRELAS